MGVGSRSLHNLIRYDIHNIPAYNEESRIVETLKDYTNYFSKSEIIVVCDGHDKTAEMARSFGGVKVLRYKKRLGKWGALYQGFKKASGDLIGFTDADNSIIPEEFDKLIKNIRGCDVTIASRRLKGSVLIEKIFHSYVL